MSELDDILDDLNSGASTNGAGDPAAFLTSALGLGSVGRVVVGAKVFGRGPNARVDLLVSGDEKIVFERFSDIAKPTSLQAHLVTSLGVVKTIKGPVAAQVTAAIFRLAKHHRESTMDEAATEWGTEYLRLSPTMEVTMTDQLDRWQAFSRLASTDPSKDADEARSAFGYATCTTTLVDRDTGMRYVRSGWFLGYVKREVGVQSPEALSKQMEAVGWERPNSEGRIKATSPNDHRRHAWRFYTVEATWDGQVPAGSQSYARAYAHARERGEPAGTGNLDAEQPGTPDSLHGNLPKARVTAPTKRRGNRGVRHERPRPRLGRLAQPRRPGRPRRAARAVPANSVAG